MEQVKNNNILRRSVCMTQILFVLAGIRHLVWDRDPESTLNNDDVNKSSQILVAATVAASLALAIV